MLARNADAGSTNIFFKHAHALNIFNYTLKKRQSIVFNNIAVLVYQQHA